MEKINDFRCKKSGDETNTVAAFEQLTWKKNCSSIFASGYNFNTVEALKSTEEYNLIIKEYNIFLLNLKHYIYDDYFQVGECKSE